jgi:hypothetical protein
MRVAIMQPYFLPYIGYWQLIHAVDTFVVYDNIKYTKKGWINRNRLLLNGQPATFSLPLQKASDALMIRDRRLSKSFHHDDLLKQFEGAYHHAPYFSEVMPMLKEIVRFPGENLFDCILNSIRQVCEVLGIATKVVVSSSLEVDHSLKSGAKVRAICASLGASVYINPSGGRLLYLEEEFALHGLDLRFLDSIPFTYLQGPGEFVPTLSIVDVLMFCPRAQVTHALTNGYTLS